MSFRQRLRVLVPCITVCSDEAKPMGEHTKFYDMRVKKLKEMQALGIITVKYCEIANMVADLFTKNVNAAVRKTGECSDRSEWHEENPVRAASTNDKVVPIVPNSKPRFQDQSIVDTCRSRR